MEDKKLETGSGLTSAAELFEKWTGKTGKDRKEETGNVSLTLTNRS